MIEEYWKHISEPKNGLTEYRFTSFNYYQTLSYFLMMLVLNIALLPDKNLLLSDDFCFFVWFCFWTSNNYA